MNGTGVGGISPSPPQAQSTAHQRSRRPPRRSTARRVFRFYPCTHPKNGTHRKGETRQRPGCANTGVVDAGVQTRELRLDRGRELQNIIDFGQANAHLWFPGGRFLPGAGPFLHTVRT